MGVSPKHAYHFKYLKKHKGTGGLQKMLTEAEMKPKTGMGAPRHALKFKM